MPIPGRFAGNRPTGAGSSYSSRALVYEGRGRAHILLRARIREPNLLQLTLSFAVLRKLSQRTISAAITARKCSGLFGGAASAPSAASLSLISGELITAPTV